MQAQILSLYCSARTAAACMMATATSTVTSTAASQPFLPNKVLLKEGILQKRQRGQKASNLRKLRFQQRYVCLTAQEGLTYYDRLRV